LSSKSDKITEVKLILTDPIVGYNGKNNKDISNIQSLVQQNPGMSQQAIVDACPDSAIGDLICNI